MPPQLTHDSPLTLVLLFRSAIRCSCRTLLNSNAYLQTSASVQEQLPVRWCQSESNCAIALTFVVMFLSIERGAMAGGREPDMDIPGTYNCKWSNIMVLKMSDLILWFEQVTYRAGLVQAHGQVSGTPAGNVVLSEQEQLTGMFGKAGPLISQLGFNSSRGTPYGPWGGGTSGFPFASGGPVVAIFGGTRAGCCPENCLVALGVWMSNILAPPTVPAPPPPPYTCTCTWDV